HVGQLVSVTGMLSNRQMQVWSLRRVASSSSKKHPATLVADQSAAGVLLLPLHSCLPGVDCPPMARSLARTLLLILACTALWPARAQEAPLRLAIAGLVHGHVAGFLRAAQARKDVRIVGVFD